MLTCGAANVAVIMRLLGVTRPMATVKTSAGIGPNCPTASNKVAGANASTAGAVHHD